MQITVNIMLGPGETFGMTPDEVAAAVLSSLNADESKDLVTTHVQSMGETGSAGALVNPGAPPPSGAGGPPEETPSPQ